MRLLHIITNFEKLAGAEQALINLVGSGLGSENRIISLRSDALAGQLSLPVGCEVQSLGLPRTSLIRAWRKLKSSASDYRPDAVIGWMYHGNVAASLLQMGARSRPLVWTVHHSLADLRAESLSTKLAIAASALFSRSAGAIVYASKRARDQHRRIFGNPKRSVIIPNALQIECSSSPKARGSGTTVGFAARYHPTKDFRTFIRTVLKVHAVDRSVRFIACGQGASMDNAELAELAREEGLGPEQIEWTGPRRDMAAFYSELDLFLLTSRAEGFGMVLAEATGHGVPCVSTDVGAAREIIGEFGRIVPVGDADALAGGVIEELSRTETARQTRSRAAMERIATEFSPAAVRAEYMNVLKSLQTGSSNRS
jgi:glycosyltransferase involved in cell wall biosynthesis